MPSSCSQPSTIGFARGPLTSRTPCIGDIVVANIDEQYTVKRLRKVRGRFELHPENASVRYPTLIPTTELQIFGVVTSHIVEHLKKPVKG